MPLTIQTERPEIILRQLTIEDSRPLFELIDRNRAHLSQFGDPTAENYPSHDSTLKSIVHPSNPRKLRFGIWQYGYLAGTINLIPSVFLGVVGYWVAKEFTRRGFASLATQALCNYAETELGYMFLIALVHEDNIASQNTLRKSGFEYGRRSREEKCFLVFRRIARGSPQ